MEEDRIDAPFGVDFYVWIPVKNHMAPKIEQLDFGVSVLEKLVAMGRKVYVHCKNGHGRAPTMVAAYLVKKGSAPAGAEKFIFSKRPSIHLEDAQREALEDFSKKI